MVRFSTFGTALAAVLFAGPVHADDNTVTVGMILPMTGQQASTGKQERAGAELYIQQHGDTVAGKKIVLEIKEEKQVEAIKPSLPRVTDLFQTYLRELRPSDLNGSAGLFRLKEELTKRVNAAVSPSQVSAVLFKEVLVQ